MAFTHTYLCVCGSMFRSAPEYIFHVRRSHPGRTAVIAPEPRRDPSAP